VSSVLGISSSTASFLYDWVSFLGNIIVSASLGTESTNLDGLRSGQVCK
jgi:hypothetical protein